MSKLPDHGTTTSRIDRREERDGVVIRLTGPINEHFDRVKFVSSSTNRIVIVDLDGVGWITSFGIREWVTAIKEIPKSYLAFINVRPSVVQQFNMLMAFGGDGELLSFYAPFACPHCSHYQENLIDLLELHPMVKRCELPPMACEACGQQTELDDIAESYLEYVVERSRPPSPPPEYHDVLRGEPSQAAPRQRLVLEKLVEDDVTVLMIAGDLGDRASFKRAATGLEGTIALSFSRVRSYNREGIARLRPLWEVPGPRMLLVEAPLPLVQALPDESWRRFQILSLRAEMQCPQGHVLRDALIQNNEIWRLARGTDPLTCPSCGEPLAAAGLDALVALGAVATPSPETEQAVTAIVERRHRAKPPLTGFASEEVGRYTLIDKLGVGGMAEVFLARQRGVAGFEKTVVLKRILPHLAEDQHFIEMFLQEARLASRVRHPNVVQIFDVGQPQRTCYIAMEYIQGWDLGRLLQYATSLRRPFPLPLAARICAQVAAALDAAHGALDHRGDPTPIIHRDVSPQNILLSREGAVKLTDFGIAKALDNGRLTPTTTLKGKLSYMAPEVVLGTVVDTRADLFSLGIVLYELITLEKLFRRASDYATVHALLHDPIPSLSERRPDVPPELDRIGLRVLARDPDQRYPSARELCDDLHAFAAASGARSPTLAEYLAQLVVDAAHLREDKPEGAREEQITIEY